MDHFLFIADKIKEDPSYQNSRIFQLDALLFDTESVIAAHFSRIRINVRIHSSRAFVALAAPSMEGKTQSAFVMEKALNIDGNIISESTQHIYLNFLSQSRTIHIFALDDLKTISLKTGRYVPVSMETLSAATISANDLQTGYFNTKLWVLGFLVKLIQDSNLNYSSENSVPWMKYYSTLPNLNITAISVGEIQPEFFNGYCLFLDEFIETSWAVYIRNLARAVGLRCVLANTNTRIANLTGKRTCSGGFGEYIWSIIVNQLNNASVTLLNNAYNFDFYIQAIRRLGRNDPNVDLFVNDLISKQISHLRPGVAVFLAQVIQSFVEHEVPNSSSRSINLRQLLNYLCKSLITKMIERKPSLDDKEGSYCAKIMLLTPFAYQSSRIISSHECYHFNLFLENHLYYLINPNDPKGWIFLAFPPKKKHLRVLVGSNILSWKKEYTFFRSE